MAPPLSASSDCSSSPLSRAQRAHYRLSWHEPLELARSPSSYSGSQKASPPSSACQQRNESSRCLRPLSPRVAERLLRLSEGHIMACFFLLPLIFPTFWFLRSPLLSCPETLGSCSLNFPCSHTLWLCFSGPNLVAHLVGCRDSNCVLADGRDDLWAGSCRDRGQQGSYPITCSRLRRRSEKRGETAMDYGPMHVSEPESSC